MSARKEVEKRLVLFDTHFICGKSSEAFFPPHLSANVKLLRHTTNENPVGGENSESISDDCLEQI